MATALQAQCVEISANVGSVGLSIRTRPEHTGSPGYVYSRVVPLAQAALVHVCTLTGLSVLFQQGASIAMDVSRASPHSRMRALMTPHTADIHPAIECIMRCDHDERPFYIGPPDTGRFSDTALVVTTTFRRLAVSSMPWYADMRRCFARPERSVALLVEADAALARALRSRSDLGQRAASNWLLPRTVEQADSLV